MILEFNKKTKSWLFAPTQILTVYFARESRKNSLMNYKVIEAISWAN